MADQHISESELKSLFEGTATANLRRKVVRHLLSTCQQCLVMAGTVSGPYFMDIGDDCPTQDLGEGYTVFPYVLRDESLKKLAQHEKVLVSRVNKEKEEAFRAWRSNPGVDLQQIKPSRITISAPYIQLLINESRAAVREDPQKALALAKKASSLVGRMPQSLRRVIKEDLQAQTLLAMANASRAEEKFRDARVYLHLSGECDADLITLAWGAKISGLLLRDEGRFERAADEMLSSLRIYEEIGEQMKVASMLVSLAFVYRHFAPETGLQVARQAQELLDGQDEHLEICALSAAIDCMNESGDPLSAGRLYFVNRKLLMKTGPRNRMAIRWLAARIDRALYMRSHLEDHYFAAEATYLDLISDYDTKGMYQEMSIASLQIAQMHHTARRKDKALYYLQSAVTSCHRSGIRADLVEVLRTLAVMVQEDRLTERAIAAANNTLTRRWKVQGEPTNS